MPTLDTPPPAWLANLLHRYESLPRPVYRRSITLAQEALRRSVRTRITEPLALAGADPDSCAAALSDWYWIEHFLNHPVVGLDAPDEDAISDLITAIMHWWDLAHAGSPTPSAGTLFPQLFRRAAGHYRVESVALSILTQGEPGPCNSEPSPSPPESPS